MHSFLSLAFALSVGFPALSHAGPCVPSGQSATTTTQAAAVSGSSGSYGSSGSSAAASSSSSAPSAYSNSSSNSYYSSYGCSSNTPFNRSSWCNGYNLTTNPYTTIPDTGNTVEYWFELGNYTAAPDGVSRDVLLINGIFPGPTIEANWGDTVVVHFKNNLQTNGSSLHFHGVRQNKTNQMDGTVSITQCPVAPGDSYTYTWKASQYGSSWYHSHFGLQTWEGAFGGIVIHGPATADYDTDLGNLFMNDWSHETVDELYDYAEATGPPTMDNALINGTNVYNSTGERFEVVFSYGTKYLLRLVNSAINTHFKFSIDNHTLTVIAMDFVPIVPFETDYISIGIGQRYDVIVEANQTVGDYWLRAIPQTACSYTDNVDNIKGIVRYDSSSTADPTTTAYDMPNDCNDEPAASLVPYVALNVGPDSSPEDLNVTSFFTSDNLFRWAINNVSMALNWQNPTLLQVYDGVSNFTANESVVEVNGVNEWVYTVIETTDEVPHPIHLHGHDFFVIASGTGSFDLSSGNYTTTNPPRRDVAMLPGNGYLAIAFQTDNPGAWPLHCHIGWHQEMGFAVQFVERYDEIKPLIDFDVLNSTCSAWDAWQDANNVVDDTSGI
ncbi:multicopper oxidase [Xylona heveae TC161]|uniref:Multicopper oxidase n=1 Tax=Xylona heveae (strain CBS 132557 / TC161) TaxID=1328760 RepID=A0A165GQ50_XYLHT|nr:multicopper oxidase [Xylona heveae TC161]KZF22459.1 multicopper oxidase [Xylona heveae TC161]